MSSTEAKMRCDSGMSRLPAHGTGKGLPKFRALWGFTLGGAVIKILVHLGMDGTFLWRNLNIPEVTQSGKTNSSNSSSHNNHKGP